MKRSVLEILESRLLNPDAAGLVAERLDQATLIRLVEWFVDEDGGDGGSVLAMRAPIFDALVQRCVDTLSDGEDSPRLVAIALFGSGIGVGAHWLAVRDADEAFPEPRDLAEIQRSLEGFELPEPSRRARSELEAAGDAACDPLALMHRLFALDSRIEVVVQATFRMAMEVLVSGFGGPRRVRSLAQSPVSRLVFFAGMVGGGLRVPVIATPREGEDDEDADEDVEGDGVAGEGACSAC